MDITFEDGVYHGWVINGNWHLMYDTELKGLFACHSREAADNLVAVTKSYSELKWACDPSKALFDYNIVIEEARKRYESGEPANFELKQKEPVIEYDEEDNIPF